MENARALLLHNQHAIGAAIDEVTKWPSEKGEEELTVNATMVMELLDTNAQALTDATRAHASHRKQCT